MVYDTKLNKITSEIAVGANPNELLLNKKGNLLFVANANDNSVSVIDVHSRDPRRRGRRVRSPAPRERDPPDERGQEPFQR